MMFRYGLSLITRGRWLPFRALDRAIAEIDAVIHEEITHRRAHPGDTKGKDCLSVFLRMQQEQGDDCFLDDHMIAAFQRLLLLAGYETTATTLAWVAERLVRHPHILAKLDQTLTAGDDTYLDAVIAEAMRVQLAVPYHGQVGAKGLRHERRHTSRRHDRRHLHQRPPKRANLYSDAETFDPERFVGNRPDPRHWMPFGGGAHHCLGAQFALIESRVLLR